MNGDTIRRVLTRRERGAIRSRGVVAVLVLELRLVNCNVLTRLAGTVLITRLVVLVVLRRRGIGLLHRNSHINVVRRAIRVGDNDRNGDLVTRLRVLRDGDGDLASVLVDLYPVGCVLTRGKGRAVRSRGVVAVLVLELRLVDGDILTRLAGAVLVVRLIVLVLVRNLRVGVVVDFLVIRDAVTVIIRIRNVRIPIAVRVQLEVGRHVIHGLVRVGHGHRDVKVLHRILVQLRLVGERHRDLAGGLVNLDLVALGSGVALRDGERRVLRSLSLLALVVLDRWS